MDCEQTFRGALDDLDDRDIAEWAEQIEDYIRDNPELKPFKQYINPPLALALAKELRVKLDPFVVFPKDFEKLGEYERNRRVNMHSNQQVMVAIGQAHAHVDIRFLDADTPPKVPKPMTEAERLRAEAARQKRAEEAKRKRERQRALAAAREAERQPRRKAATDAKHAIHRTRGKDTATTRDNDEDYSSDNDSSDESNDYSSDEEVSEGRKRKMPLHRAPRTPREPTVDAHPVRDETLLGFPWGHIYAGYGMLKAPPNCEASCRTPPHCVLGCMPKRIREALSTAIRDLEASETYELTGEKRYQGVYESGGTKSKKRVNNGWKFNLPGTTTSIALTSEAEMCALLKAAYVMDPLRLGSQRSLHAWAWWMMMNGDDAAEEWLGHVNGSRSTASSSMAPLSVGRETVNNTSAASAASSSTAPLPTPTPPSLHEQRILAIAASFRLDIESVRRLYEKLDRSPLVTRNRLIWARGDFGEAMELSRRVPAIYMINTVPDDDIATLAKSFHLSLSDAKRLYELNGKKLDVAQNRLLSAKGKIDEAVRTSQAFTPMYKIVNEASSIEAEAEGDLHAEADGLEDGVLLTLLANSEDRTQDFAEMLYAAGATIPQLTRHGFKMDVLLNMIAQDDMQ